MAEHHPPLTPQEAQALAGRVADGMYSRDRASQAMGMRIANIAPGRAELRMTVRRHVERPCYLPRGLHLHPR